MTRQLKAAAGQTWPAMLAILLALGVSAILLAATGHDPVAAYKTLFKGAFGNSHRISETLVKAIPILVIALGTSIAFKCKLWNIGGNGQYTAGAIAAVAVAVYLPLPPVILIPLSLAASVAAGSLVGGILGGIRAKFNANEVITTLMANYVIVYLLSWLVNGPMMDPKGFGFPQTPLIAENLMLPQLLPPTRLHAGLFIALALVVLVILFWKTRAGFRICLAGESHEVARANGVNVKQQIILTMILSSVLPALAGWIDVFGIHGRLQENLAGELGTIAIVVALLGGLNPVGIAFASLFFAALVVGGATMQRFEGVPGSLVGIIQGLVIIFVICRVVFENYKERRRVKQLVH